MFCSPNYLYIQPTVISNNIKNASVEDPRTEFKRTREINYTDGSHQFFKFHVIRRRAPNTLQPATMKMCDDYAFDDSCSIIA